MKRSFFLIFVILLLGYLIGMPGKALAASKEGLNLWFYSVLPSLLPFCILSDILIGTGRISGLLRPLEAIFRTFLGLSPAGAYAFLLGLFCGYPMGARMTGELYRQNEISYSEARYLLSFSNNASPVFLLTYLLHDQLNAFHHTWLMLCIFYGTLLLTACMMRFYYTIFAFPKKEKEKRQKEGVSETAAATSGQLSMPFSQLLDTAIMNGFEVVTRLGGYIILFSITAALIHDVSSDFPLVSPVLTGFIEMTNGIHAIAQSAFSEGWKYTLIWTVTSFGGISTLAQTKGMLNGTPLSLRDYLIGKIVHTVLTFSACILIFVFKIVHI